MPEAIGKSLRISFLLPGDSTEPSGGNKVVYEYANYLTKKGHRVTVVHPAFLLLGEPLFQFDLRHNVRTLRTIKSYIQNKATGNFKPTAWFEVLSSVQLLWVPTLAARYIPDADIVFAGAWQTAEWVEKLPPSKGKKFYLIQHLETWAGPQDRVMATWKMPLEKIAIARWLQSIAEGLGETAHLVHNGLDFERFRVMNALDARDPNNLLMLFSSQKWKGSADGIAAFEIARKQEPGLRLALFGTPPPPDVLPSGVTYHRNPPQHVLRDLHNQASIFLSPSWTEGFPLPPAEALQCGGALVSTNIGGTAMYAIHEQTALLSPIKDPEAMAANILRLVRNPDLRLKLARNGNAKIQEFTWERAGSSLETILIRSL
jgi:glycosyltransferase involved in cell wall biosynthesis